MVDEIDSKILTLLQKDGKMTFKEIANELDLTTTPVYERIKKMEKNGVIQSYKAIVDRRKLGLQLLVFCNVSLKEHQASFLENFENDIVNFPEVISCYHIAGMYDYLIQLTVKDMDEYQVFISKKIANINNIAKVQSSFVMTEVKTNQDLPTSVI
ncbi:MAG: AsnC family transcriptional regulator [Crocinitomicaceae bacterium]|nr:AsnC family transcriptional regulator [Crocinitomicaceae bacterium]